MTWHAPSGQFRKYVGKQFGRTGQPSPKVFYLGTDEKSAIRQATRLLAQWDALKATGAAVWPSERPPSVSVSPSPQAAQTELVRPDNLTVRDAANLYLDELHRRAAARQVGWAHYQHSEHRLKRILEVIGPMTPLRSVGATELNRLALHFASRPPTKRQPHQKKGFDRPISIKTAKDFVSQAKALFGWIADHDRVHWEKPKGFERCFRIKWQLMKTPEELEREQNEVVTGEVKTFASEDLAKLFKAATDRERLYLLLALNCGFTSSEVGTLRRFEIDLNAEQPFIHRKRPKTGVEARWALWPETVQAIRANFAPTNPGKLAFLTEAGNPLVEVNATCRRDVIDQTWGRLLERAQLKEPLGYRFLRKTGAHRIKMIGGYEVSEMYLAHAEQGTMNRHYANRNWTEMHRCLGLLRHEFEAMWKVKAVGGSESVPPASPADSTSQREAA